MTGMCNDSAMRWDIASACQFTIACVCMAQDLRPGTVDHASFACERPACKHSACKCSAHALPVIKCHAQAHAAQAKARSQLWTDLGGRQAHEGLSQLGLELVKDRGAEAGRALPYNACDHATARVARFAHLVYDCSHRTFCTVRRFFCQVCIISVQHSRTWLQHASQICCRQPDILRYALSGIFLLQFCSPDTA